MISLETFARSIIRVSLNGRDLMYDLNINSHLCSYTVADVLFYYISFDLYFVILELRYQLKLIQSAHLFVQC